MTDPTLPVPNIPLLRKAVEWAEAEAAKPADQCEWNQEWFAQAAECGAAYCIAGWAVLQSIPGAQVTENDGLAIDGECADWWATGREVLGLTADECSLLFSPGNDVEGIRRAADEIAARAGDKL